MSRNYGRSNRAYASSRVYGKKPDVMETKYSPHGKHVPSRERFSYPNGHNFPVPEDIARKIERIMRNIKRSKGTHKLDDVLPLLGIITGAFLLSGDLTGNAIANLTRTDANIAGAFAIIIGIVGLLVSRKR